MLALTLTTQVIYGGFIDGLSIGLLALGIVLIYRSNRVINFAVAAIGALSAAILAMLVVRYHWSYWPAAVVALAAGVAFSAGVEATVITRLFRVPRVILLVATIGIAQLAQAGQAALPSLKSSIGQPFPAPLPGTWHIGGLRVRGAELSVIIVVPLLALGLTLFLTRTDLGKAIRAAAADPDRARLSAINPKALSTLVWAISGGISAISLILLAGTSGSVTGLTTIGPSTLSRVLAAALLARMTSFSKALAAGIAIGVVEAVIRFNSPLQSGLPDGLLFVVVLLATWWMARRDDRAAEDASFSFAPRVKAIPERLRELWWVRALPRMVGLLALAAAIVLPLVVVAPSKQLLYSRMLLLAVVGLSLVVLTGWAGQISLGQAAFAGLGGLGYAALVNGNTLGLGYGSHHIVLSMPKVSPVVAVVAVTVACAVTAAIIGVGALRVRGLLLGVVTYAFALAAQQYLFTRPFLAGGTVGTVFVERPIVAGVDFASQRAYYYLSLGALVITMVVVGRLRRSGIGRSIIGVRDNAEAAAAYTVSPARSKLRAFAISGAIAGFGGALLGGLLANINTAEVFTVGDSLQVVSIAVIGGVGTVAGPILGALWVVGLPAFWPSSTIVPLLASSVGLLVLLMYFPGGLAQIGYSARDGLLRWADRRSPDRAPAPRPSAVPQRTKRPAAPGWAASTALAISNTSVRFGGRLAVADVSLRVDAGQVVGLIGTNGAGKTTLMNAIGGFVPASGKVELLEGDITKLSPAKRAGRGLGRTFQAARLFPDLTVVETIEVAMEARHQTSLISTLLMTPWGFRTGRTQRREAGEIVDFLGLGRYADHFIADLSTGTRRIVELGALLALDARVLCLDEPTAGVAQRETEAFGPLLLRIRDELDASLLVIEHDMPLIMSISDHVYCLEAGAVIADGTPDDVRHDPAVVASYLGTDTRAIERSGETTSTPALR